MPLKGFLRSACGGVTSAKLIKWFCWCRLRGLNSRPSVYKTDAFQTMCAGFRGAAVHRFVSDVP